MLALASMESSNVRDKVVLKKYATKMRSRVLLLMVPLNGVSQSPSSVMAWWIVMMGVMRETAVS